MRRMTCHSQNLTRPSKETRFEEFDNVLAVCGEITDAKIVISVFTVPNKEAIEDEEGNKTDQHNLIVMLVKL